MTQRVSAYLADLAKNMPPGAMFYFALVVVLVLVVGDMRSPSLR